MKEQKGITLIALVVTIVILLILINISINLVIGDNGIIYKASRSKEKKEIQIIIQNARMDIFEVQRDNKGEIKESQLDEILSNYDKDGEIKTNEENEEYIITEKGYKIKVSEIWNLEDLNEDKTEGVRVEEIFDSTGEIEGKLHIGDFINYTAGEWTLSEINSIGANNSLNTPSQEYQFGGFIEGGSRDENATPCEKEYDYVKDKNTNESITGWRLFDVTDGVITLISAGCPEDFYYNPNPQRNGLISEYILTGDLSKYNLNDYAEGYGLGTTYKQRDWSMYVNPDYKATSATALTKTRLEEWHIKNYNIENPNFGGTPYYFRFIYGTKNESLIDNYSRFWLCNCSNTAGLYYINPYATRVVAVNTYNVPVPMGIRVLVTLDSNVRLSENSIGTKTITSRDVDYDYNIWELKV